MGKRLYRVYVIELSKRVFNQHQKFRAANPQYNGVQDCLYVGVTSKTPKERHAQHLSGAKSKKGVSIASRIVQQYGTFLRPSLYQHIPPMEKKEALNMEEQLALELRRKGHAVWFN